MATVKQAKKRRPKYVHTLNLRWTVKYTEKALTAAMGKQQESLHGHCDLDNLTITVNGKLPESKVQELLLHEVMHACLFAQGETHEISKDDESEESIVRGLAPVLLHTLHTSPGLMRYLLS